jgi:hypothetical protein
MILAPAALFLQNKELSPKEIFRRCSPSIATVIADDLDGNSSSGTCYVVGIHRVATCWHVISEARTIQLKFLDNVTVTPKIIAADPEKDIAILSYPGERVPLRSSPVAPPPGEHLYAIGAPGGFAGSIVDGLMSQARQFGSRNVYQISNPVTFGNSGGPVLDDRGEVVGMVSFNYAAASALNFAVPAREVSDLAKSTDAPIPVEEFRSQKLLGYHVFINRHRTGDECNCTMQYSITAPNGNILTLTEAQTQEVTEANDNGETRVLTTTKSQALADGKTIELPPKRPTISHLDLFFHRIHTPDEHVSIDQLRGERADEFQPPDTIGLVLKAGTHWQRLMNSNDPAGVPLALYKASFDGFEDVNGVRCAKVTSTYTELEGDHPIVNTRTMWMVYGLEVVKEIDHAQNELLYGTYCTIDAELRVTYWKFGPPQFNKRASQ